MTSWYCVEMWRMMIALPLLMCGSVLVSNGLHKQKGVMFLVGIMATAGAILLLVIPTTAGGGG